MTKRVSLGLMISVALLVSMAAGVVLASHSWSKYHWDIATADAPLEFGDNLTTDWTSSLVGASSDWNGSVIKNQILPSGSNAACDPLLGRVEVCNDQYGANGWLGIAQVWVYRGKDGHIAQGLVKVNDTYFNMPQYNTQAWRDYVVCQEVGHTLGLNHQDENFDNTNLGTCMDYTSDPNGPPSNLDPNQHDYDVLTEKYAHLNGTSTDGGGKKGGGKGGGNKGKKGEPPGQNVREWGKGISKDGKGRSDLFELDLGKGKTLFTHVIWAD